MYGGSPPPPPPPYNFGRDEGTMRKGGTLLYQHMLNMLSIKSFSIRDKSLLASDLFLLGNRNDYKMELQNGSFGDGRICLEFRLQTN